jgi:serine/threonine-protein phosphatase 2A regulatory subunit B'
MKLIQRVKRQIGSEQAPSGKAPAPSAPTNLKKTTGAKPSTRKAPAEDNPFSSLPSLRETAVADRPEILKKKLQACSITFDFTNAQLNATEKEAKRQALLELVEYVNNTRHCFNDSVIQDVIEMVASNIFRALPPPHSKSGGEDEDEPTLESAWPHLQIVYEFFLRFVVSHEVDPKIAKKYIDQTFVLMLLELFDSEDPRERDYLKTILHRIYGKIMALRLFIRKAAQNLFYRIIIYNETHNGVPELLEILGSIINGFALPLKEEHKTFLERSLLPLHTAKNLNAFHQQLGYCMMQYVEKDPRLCTLIIDALLRVWSVTNTSKEVLFLNEVEEVLEMTQPPEFQQIQVALFNRIAQCIRSPHFQVAERALFIWNNDDVVKLINQSRQVIFPIVLSALYQNSKQHWNGTVHGLTYNVLKLLMEADAALFDECSAKQRQDTDRDTAQQEARDKAWGELTAKFNENAPQELKELCIRPKIPDINADGSSNLREF